MNRRNRIQWYCIALLAFCLAACQTKRPDTVLPDDKMEKVLYDFHIAKAMGDEVSYSDNYKRVLYMEAVYKKHGITKADFDSSMVWFARHPDALSKIYEQINARLKAEKSDISRLIAIRDHRPEESQPGDSIDVWIWQRIRQLSGMPLDNKLTFELPSDTNFKDRDTLRWTVRFRFLNGIPDSVHAPLMAMQVLYAKDTLDTYRKVTQTGMETLALHADTLGEIKEIRGFIYYPDLNPKRSLLADRISLMRYHATDTLFNALAKDSISTPAKKAEEKPAATKPNPEKKAEEVEKKDAEKPASSRPEMRPRPRMQKTTDNHD